ncbi:MULTISPECIES: ATP-binding protein [Kitasatospora]|uniref:ATP-binding protein n=1 Tax=Kitasatospora cathayae TaxID=3004092 RepID=A0ABY7PYY6_9ACTN|nr:ATP-binding protein [Kitasatospora sp. HUAS 3-15]WBP85630.1 ATP-binding protein [Kitasatospora sp. HUAS 3-15]
MARGKLWGYVASGARALGALGGAGGGVGGGGAGRKDGAGASNGLGPYPPIAMAGPRTLSRTELDQLRWTGRQAGCEPQARHVQVSEVVRRVVRGGGRAAAVTVRLAPGLPVVAGDARRMEAAVAGLVDHAIRRSPLGGRVLVRADVGRAGPAAPRTAAGRGTSARGRERVEIRISDRGAYEPPQTREWLLAGVRATGPVGPALHSLVLAAGGRLAVEPTPGGGLTVVLLLAVAYD